VVVEAPKCIGSRLCRYNYLIGGVAFKHRELRYVQTKLRVGPKLLGRENHLEGFIVWLDPGHRLRIREKMPILGQFEGRATTCALSTNTEVGDACIGGFHRFRVREYRTTTRILSVELHQHLHGKSAFPSDDES